MVINLAQEFQKLAQQGKQARKDWLQKKYEKSYIRLLKYLEEAASEGYGAVRIEPSWFNNRYKTVAAYNQTLINSGFHVSHWDGIYKHYDISWY